MFRRASVTCRFGLPVIGSVIVLAALTTLEINLANPSGALPPSVHVLPPGSTFNNPVAVSSDKTHVWVVNNRGNSVTELGAATGALVQVISGSTYGFNRPDAISSDGIHVWVANSWGNSVTELDASTGALVQVISTGTPPTNPGAFSPSGEFDYPAGISSNGTHVWVLNDNYYTNKWSYTELDASTGALVTLIQGPTNAATAPYMGISADTTHVWVTNAGYWIGQPTPNQLIPGFVTELDASTGALVQVIPDSSFGPFFDPTGVSSDGTHVWVASGGGASVAELDASTGALVRGISLSSYGNLTEYISSDGTHVWVNLQSGVNFQGGNLIELDASTGAVVQEIAVPSDGTYQDYQKISSDGTHLWVVNTTNQSVTEFDAATGSLVQVIPANAYGFNSPIAVTSDSSHVWVANIGSNSVTELDAATGALIQVLSGPSYNFGFGNYSGEPDAISSDGIHVWVANPANNSVTELGAATGALVQVISGSSYGFNGPFGVSSDGTHVWVTNGGNSSVTELDASTGALVQVLSDSTYGFVTPTAITSDGTHVWVQNGTHFVGATWSPFTVTELDAATGALVQVISGLFFTSISSDGTHVWGVGGGNVTELDASTGTIVQTISPSGLNFPQSISSDGTNVWVTSTGNNEVIELDAATGALVQVISGSTYGLDWPTGISSDGTNVWVTSEYGNSVTELGTGILAQRITFTSTPPSDPLVSSPPYTVSAIGGASGNPVTFSIDPSAASVCSISGIQTVSFSASGTCIIDANQAAGNGYVAARQARQSFVVGAQTITFTSTPPSNGIVGGPPYTVSATGGASGNPVTFSTAPSATSVCSVSGATVNLIGPGTCIIEANQAAGNGYGAAPQEYQSFVVGAQTITFTSRPPVTFRAPYTVTATGGGSGNPVTFSSQDPADCTVSGSTVRFVGTGWCAIVANQAGNADYSAAPIALQVFYVGSVGGGGGGGGGGGSTLSVTTASVPSATTGVRYPVFPLQASGAPAPYKWKLTGGALPSGLHLKSTGVLSGKPNKHDAAGTFTFTVDASTHHHPIQTSPPVTLTLILLP
jgi:DNA-binding beta-propeller fold protein YncE